MSNPSSEKAPRLIGVMRVCDDFAEFCETAIEPFSRACHSVCFLTDRVANPRVLAAMQACPNLLGMREQGQPQWSHKTSMVEAYRFAEEFKPDWVVAPDYDEVLPYEHLIDDVATADSLGKRCITYPFIHCWETPDTIVDPKLNSQAPHGKVYKGGDPNFAHSEQGFCVPLGYWPQIYQSKYPLRHMRNMTAELRARRASRKRYIDPWVKSTPRTFEFRDQTYAAWNALSKAP